MRPQEFQIGNLVLKHVICSTEERDAGKVGANWKGLYIVVAKEGKGSYTLATQHKEVLSKQ